MSLDLTTFVVLALATHRLTRLVTTDTIFSKLRDRFWRRFPPESSMLGYLLTCDWCTSIWTGSLVVISYTIYSSATMLVALILAVSTVAGALAARL